MATFRKEKLEELIRRIVADSLIKEIKDPRIGFTTVTRVKLSRDFSIVDIWVSVIGSEKDKKDTMFGIESATGFMQHILGKNIRLRIVPRIKFHLDESIEKGIKMVDMLEDLNKEGGDK
jgi:ribosome-binding factor A